jgi:DNA-binding NtrC family response regulator
VRDAAELSGHHAAASSMPSLRLTDAQGEVRPLEEIEREVIRFAIAHYREQMSEVARRLKIGRSTLYRKLESLGLEEAPHETAEKEKATI